MSRGTHRTSTPPATTAQRLSAIIKSCRDIMRKDRGLSGDVDRLPMLTWILFLKFLDDMEEVHGAESELAGKRHRRAIEPPYRWRDWAGKADGLTGDALIDFISAQEISGPDGDRVPGLFAHLRSLQGADGGDRRDVVRTVFQGVTNRMLNGYLLREILTKVDSIHFSSSEEIHTLSHLYETLLREMRDAAGDSGEFYTPRPVVQLMVQLVNPRLGETVLDPACGTGGFLVASFEHLKKQCVKAEDMHRVQRGSLFGIEAKPLPYLLCQMNLTLHGLEAPDIDFGNALRFPLNEIRDKDRVDVILTNPPFGGEEERGILGNFPADRQTSETALLFLQLIMKKLKRPTPANPRGGRAAVVVPNGVLFGDGVSARIKEDLLKNFSLHTIVREPNGVFNPYTAIPTNLLFFDRSGPTKNIWYYDQPVAEGRKQYTKTRPIQFEEFADLITWWEQREENERAWKINVDDVLRYDESGPLVSANLDRKNPRAADTLEHLPPEKLVEDILEKERRIIALMEEVRELLREAVK